ncbi:2,3-diaminopropionate biosynthesis protein SbnB [Streptomyces sp. RS10V-4]|uniref:2,3-diaminopropionate biosynthesis protein SbnB n=1 Tax=Streptomyces rhizoryzae TaxID=2932493 RepID=UPI002003022F|nr:2,3-diaminopropionate biosynthesis protein SbnB [Streptomyces rhizoryzae]MCK7624203.1 2,3-diaminopropionate biosynthesis protein SbnB [Streptomyces rhizoryzae]
MLIIRHDEVRELLRGQEQRVLSLVADAYRLHDEGRTALPHSVFLRFPDRARDRIIGLPAYVGGEDAVAGMKWIASFPGNVAEGRARASAAMLLNSMADGTPQALIEASLISAQRTAASAALAAAQLAPDPAPQGIALIGTGPINHEVLRFAKAQLPSLREAVVFDLDRARAAAFADRAGELAPDVTFTVADQVEQALGSQPLVSLATSAVEPHLDLAACPAGATVLHVSLRDLTVEAVLGAQNVVDDADHVCRERTTLHLAELATGGREFIAASLGALLRGTSAFRRDPARTAVFSPFGLGILDLALARWVRDEAGARGTGVRVEGFLP